MRKLFIILALCVLSATALGSHEYHTTFTKINHNLAEKNLEITIRVFSHDLIPVLEKRLEKKIDLGATDGLDTSISEYVREKFVLKTSTGEDLIPKWVGKEVDSQVVFFYLEIPFDGELDGATVSNAMFFERFREQINYVSLVFGEKKADLVFKVGDKSKKVAGKSTETDEPASN